MESKDWFKKMHDVVDGETTAEEVIAEAKKTSLARKKSPMVGKQEAPKHDYLREWEAKKENDEDRRNPPETHDHN